MAVSAKPDPDQNKRQRRAEHIRDHLANERTLLSWIRLGLSLTALGFVIALRDFPGATGSRRVGE